MDPILKLLSSVGLFRGLPDEQIQALARIAVEKKYGRNETIFTEGQPADGFYLVAGGSVKVYKVSPEGKEHILHIFGAGHPIGEVPMFTGGRFPANALCLKASRLLFFRRAAFVELISNNPSMAMNMLGVLSMRLREFTVQIENLSLKEVPGRLATYLLLLSGEQAQPDVVQLPISKGQLASLLGTIPETLSRIFARMAEAGMITVTGRRIALHDRSTLEDLALNGRLVS